MKYQHIIRAFLASPGDTAVERDALSKVTDELNLTWADFVGVRVNLIKWESHAIPAAGPDPQAAINEQLLGDDEYEIFIGILKGKLGTPTPRAASGTVEEFGRAYDRYSASGVPEIMFYLKAEVDTDVETVSFKQRLKDLGVFYWSYRSSRQFEQACRIHLSRQIQRVARGDFVRSEQGRTFPDPEGLDLLSALQAVRSLIQEGTRSLEKYAERTNNLTELTHGVAQDMRTTSEKLNRLGRPGFRQPKGGGSGIIRVFAKKLDRYAESLERFSQELMVPYASGLDAYSRALGIISPLAPLPALFRPSIEDSNRAIRRSGQSLSELRSAGDKARNAIAESGWERLDNQALKNAKRRALDALDSMDREITESVHLTREVSRLTEEFLEG